jgi:beta-1,4-mannosyl-glycoprotein beta-1,4-N-acetylglucosaminyltransferase
MKIFDCFMYNNEELILNLRLNYLEKKIEKFIIVESEFDHQGE